MPSDVLKRYRQLAQQAEERLARRHESEKILIQVGDATCENAAGARIVHEEFEKHLKASGRDDIILRASGCTGRCSCEPIVTITFPGKMPVKYERVDRDMVHRIFTSHVMQGQVLTENVLDHTMQRKYQLLFCTGQRCAQLLNKDFRQICRDKLQAAGIGEDKAVVTTVNCFGLCRGEEVGHAAHVLVRPTNIVYRVAADTDLDAIIQEHILHGRVAHQQLVQDASPLSKRFFDLYGDVAFFSRQSRVALRNSGIVNPDCIDEYIHFNGFEALARALDKNDAKWIIDEVTASKLRGRGGGGFPTGAKWAAAAKETDPVKYIICNADEGDPGAFMDRSMLEGDPFSVIEGMIIGAFAIGAHQGFFYIRAEYPLAIKRIQKAIDTARQHGLLGQNIFGSGFDFDLEIRLGAGAFVCGEETALLRSIEGERGQPSIRPPFPAQKGLWEKPTVINNVETWANIPVVIHYGASWFSRLGTEKSGGTKVFALAGKVNHTGLVEVPMGTTLREIVYDIGGGVPNGKKLKAIQTGGPAGGCLPAEWLDTIVDFDSLMQAGSIMGSGGMIVMDEDDCMVDIAKFFLTFSQDESCGKCTPCREGTKRMLEILEKITSGKATLEDLDKLERLAMLVKKSSLCGLGRAAPNPVLSTLRHYRQEYLSHVVDRACPAKKCVALVRYDIDTAKCVGCTACARQCPVQCISGKPREPHTIDQKKCVKCGRCYQVCRFQAVLRT